MRSVRSETKGSARPSLVLFPSASRPTDSPIEQPSTREMLSRRTRHSHTLLLAPDVELNVHTLPPVELRHLRGREAGPLEDMGRVEREDDVGWGGKRGDLGEGREVEAGWRGRKVGAKQSGRGKVSEAWGDQIGWQMGRGEDRLVVVVV